MELKLKRKALEPEYTIGDLFINGEFFCNTLEDTYRDLSKEKKIPGKTAIPYGRYEVILNYSPRFKKELPRLLNVPFFDGILIHGGNTPEDTEGCILVGENAIKGKVINSTSYKKKLIDLFIDARKKGEKSYITIE